MKTLVEPLEGNKVKLSVEVDPAEFESAMAAAFKRIARDVRIPGFRPGKAPRRVIESRIGLDAAREEALRHSLPDFYSQAVRTSEVDPIAPPEIDVTSDGGSGPVAFEAVVEVRPTVSIAGYEDLTVTVPGLAVTDEDVDAQVDRLRNTNAELIEVERPAASGDVVTIDVSGSRDGEHLDSMSADGVSYEIGSASIAAEVDDALRGANVGDVVDVDADMAAQGHVDLQITLKAVREKKLPDLTDEWASEASEFETLEELRASLRTRLSSVRRVTAYMSLRDNALRALVDLVSEDPPESLVQAELERRAHDFGHRLDSQGVTLPDYLDSSGRTQEDLVEELRNGSYGAVKADLALRALAEAQGVEVTDEDVDTEIAAMAERIKSKPAQLKRDLEKADRLPGLRSDVRKGKALTWLVDNVRVLDEAGEPIDRSQLDLSDLAAAEGSAASSEEPTSEALTSDAAVSDAAVSETTTSQESADPSLEVTP
jgi:trigger factor